MLHLHSLVRRHALLPSIQLRRVFFSTGTSVSSSGAAASHDPHFMVEYLVDTCGFSADNASMASKLLPRSIQSTEKPDAVLGFFRSQGLDGANLRRIIAWKPGLLGWDVETNLAPKFKILREMGLSESDIIDIVRLHPIVIGYKSQNTLLSRLKVWESLFGSREILLKNLRMNKRFISNSIKNVNPDSLRAVVDRVEGIGIPRKSKMFLYILDVLHEVSREKFEAQGKLMNSFGWSNSDFITAIEKSPHFLGLSTELLQRKMEFLVNDVGISPSDIAYRPVPLVLSLEKRLIPRFQLMKILKSEGLWTFKIKLLNFFSLSSSIFLQSFVLPYKDKLPKLLEVL